MKQNNSRFELKNLIAIYERWGSSGKEFYLETHPFQDGSLGAAAPLAQDHITELLNSMQKQENKQLSGMIPRNLLYMDMTKRVFVWYQPADSYFLRLSNKIGKDGMVNMPSLIYMTSGRTLKVFATTSKMVSLKSKVYYAPLLNLNEDSAVCQGTARAWINKQTFLADTFQEYMVSFEQGFWGSEFNFGLGENHNVNYPRGASALLKRLVKTKCKFNTDWLMPLKVDNEEINLKQLIESRYDIER